MSLGYFRWPHKSADLGCGFRVPAIASMNRRQWFPAILMSMLLGYWPCHEVVAEATPSITVVSEVRTLDQFGQALSWGKGRPGAVRFGQTDLEQDLCSYNGIAFGLSLHAVPWANAAEACPLGTWVCRAIDVPTSGSCDTARWDETSFDGMLCDGTGSNFPPDGHVGWLADAPDYAVGGALKAESSFSGESSSPNCRSYPVWCCSH